MVSTQRLLESKTIIQKIANGMNPLDDTPITEESFLHHPQVLRSLFYLSDYITNEIDQKNLPHRKPTKFIITDDQLTEVNLPPGIIGINDFAKAINKVINPQVSKKLNGAMINKKLKELGILSETVDEEGKRTTVTNENSEGYGIESIQRSFNGREYQKVVFNEVGKEFLLKNIRELMG